MSQSGYLSQVVAQTVTQSPSSSGNILSVSGMTAQVITEGTAGATQVSQLIAQAVTQSTPTSVRNAQIVAQILVQNLAAEGGHFRNSSNAAQVVYTVGIQDTERQKAWTFDFDGHTFYVLDLATRGSLVYNLTTQSWSRWETQGYEGHWNMKNGFHWRGGKEVLAGGLTGGLLVGLDEDSFLDEGFRPVVYEVNGVIFSTTEAYRQQYALRLVGSPGRLGLDDEIDPPTLTMTYSDDNGATWADPESVVLTSDTEERIEFRSLGSFKQPGRIFKLTDNGGVKFIAYVMADVEGEA